MKLKRCNIYQHIILAGYFDVVLSQIPWIPKNLKNSKNQCELKIVISLSRRLFSYFSFRAKKLYLALKKPNILSRRFFITLYPQHLIIDQITSSLFFIVDLLNLKKSFPYILARVAWLKINFSKSKIYRMYKKISHEMYHHWMGI